MEGNKSLFYVGIGIVILVLASLIGTAIPSENFSNTVVIYKLQGPITNYDDFEVIYKDKVINDLDNFEKRGVKGLILEINSPGGDAYATKKIAEKLEELKKKGIPIVACIDEVGASGAYWLASEANYIVADDFSVVGSIGLIASYLQFSELMKKLGIKYERIVFGKYKDMMSPFRNLTPEEKKLIEHKLKYIYEYFVRVVAKNRHLNYSYVKSLATGEIYFGYEAVRNGLIDKIGDINTCKELIAKELNTSVNNLNFKTYKAYKEKEFNLFGLSIGYGFGEALKTFLEDKKITIN